MFGGILLVYNILRRPSSTMLANLIDSRIHGIVSTIYMNRATKQSRGSVRLIEGRSKSYSSVRAVEHKQFLIIGWDSGCP